MPRITAKTPSTGREIVMRVLSVGTAWTILADAPDFSVPDPGNTLSPRDPLDATRAIRPGAVFLLTPIFVYNKLTTTQWVEVSTLTEAGVAIMLFRAEVPTLETIQIPVQGHSLLKRVAAGANGDRLRVRAQSAAAFDVHAFGEERLSAEHVGVI